MIWSHTEIKNRNMQACASSQHRLREEETHFCYGSPSCSPQFITTTIWINMQRFSPSPFIHSTEKTKQSIFHWSWDSCVSIPQREAPDTRSRHQQILRTYSSHHQHLNTWFSTSDSTFFDKVMCKHENQSSSDSRRDWRVWESFHSRGEHFRMQVQNTNGFSLLAQSSARTSDGTTTLCSLWHFGCETN